MKNILQITYFEFSRSRKPNTYELQMFMDCVSTAELTAVNPNDIQDDSTLKYFPQNV